MRTTSGGGHAVGVSNADLARRVRERCRLTGRFVLRSGRVADEYFDKYQFEADPPLLAEGADTAGRQVLVVEDVVTSGGQIAISAGHLRDLGAHVGHALCVIDRQEGGAEQLAAATIRLHSLLRREDLGQA
jgi:orotate phosphoribosyltransferase